MPIKCGIQLPRITDDEMRKIDFAVMEQVFATHNELGRLADEAVYHQKLLQCLQAAQIRAVIEVPIELSFRDFATSHSIDLVVEDKVIYELKTVANLLAIHDSQVLGYMFMTNATHGKLVNFRSHSVETKFINTTFTSDQRRHFAVNVNAYSGSALLVRLVRELVGDWGTGLAPSLYRRAIVSCCGMGQQAKQLLPMQSSGMKIGNQRFYLLADGVAIGVTGYSRLRDGNRSDFIKLVQASPLREFHWLNVAHHHVTLTTVKKGRNT